MDNEKGNNRHGCNCNCELCCGSKNRGIKEKTANPIRVEKFLNGMDYPVSKQDIIRKAEEEGADESVMKDLNELPEKEFGSPVSISKELGKRNE